MKLVYVLMVCCGSALPGMGTCSVPSDIESSEVRRLTRDLMDIQQSASARDSIAKLAASNSKAMADVEHKVPSLIANCSSGPVWVNIVRLAGSLKMAKAVPALVQALGRQYYESPIITAPTSMRPEYDTAGRALAAIGDPAIPALSNRLNEAQVAHERIRTALILLNIDDAAAYRVLEQHLAKESEPQVKAFISGNVQRGPGHFH